MYELLILGMLTSRDMSGYKLRGILESSLVPRREISNGVMYPLLQKLAAHGYIEFKVIEKNHRNKSWPILPNSAPNGLPNSWRNPSPKTPNANQFFASSFGEWLALIQLLSCRFLMSTRTQFKLICRPIKPSMIIYKL